MLATLVAALLQSASPSASAAPVQTGSAPIESPDWLRRPSGRDIAKFYPSAAIRDDLAGRVLLSCGVNAAGRLVDCTADDPAPGAGFGEAALRLASLFQMQSARPDGRSVGGGRVRIPIVFLLPNDFRSAPVKVKDPEIHGATIELDCRFRNSHLDNCFPRSVVTERTAEVAAKLAEGISLPPMPRPKGRIVLPLVFPPKEGAVDPVLTAPKWTRRPSVMDVAKAYPAAARRAAVDGAAAAVCVVTPTGELADCTVLQEIPAGAGFGEAALKVMPLFRMEPEDAFGASVVGRKIRIPIRFTPIVPKRGTGN